MNILLFLILGLALTADLATSVDDIKEFSEQNMNDKQTYGLLFVENADDGFEDLRPALSYDEEQEFNELLENQDEIKTKTIDVSDHIMQDVADQMGIPEFPYFVVYIEGDEERNVHGPADGITAMDVMNELKAAEDQRKADEEQQKADDEQAIKDAEEASRQKAEELVYQPPDPRPEQEEEPDDEPAEPQDELIASYDITQGVPQDFTQTVTQSIQQDDYEGITVAAPYAIMDVYEPAMLIDEVPVINPMYPGYITEVPIIEPAFIEKPVLVERPIEQIQDEPVVIKDRPEVIVLEEDSDPVYISAGSINPMSKEMSMSLRQPLSQFGSPEPQAPPTTQVTKRTEIQPEEVTTVDQ